jgi:hypothetical protein
MNKDNSGELYSCQHQKKASSPCQQCNFNQGSTNSSNVECEKCGEMCNHIVSRFGEIDGDKELIEKKHVCLSDNPTAEDFYKFFTEKKIEKI